MNVWVLSQLEASPGTQRFLDAAHRAGHEATRLHPLDLELCLGAGGELDVLHGGVELALPDVVFTRMGAASPAAGLNTLLQLAALGVPVVNDPLALWRSRDKVRSSLLLARAGLPVPASLVPGRRLAAGLARARLGPPPWVVKRPEGSKGEAVFLVQDEAELESYFEAAGTTEAPVVVQRFVAEASGTDLRVFVVGGHTLAAMRRRSGSGDFRSNLHQGGHGERVEASAEAAAVAEAAVAALGLEVAGVDLLEADGGPLVIEVNGSPGFAGIEDATGADLSGAVVRYLEARVAD
ncbi:MAG: RimK family alpha-L-glutamate ligase [Planctomycetota bacterium]|nr:RimK family alpha-L-glutamate ligase [Planctomycetota bacterium]